MPTSFKSPISLLGTGLVIAIFSITGLSGIQGQSFNSIQLPRLPVGTWYITFLIEEAPPGFNLPALITFHRDGTFTAVDGGDFGALAELPFNQTTQQGVWQWSGGKEFVATGMILSFSREFEMEGQLDNVSKTRIDIEFGNDPDEFTAVVSQEFWFCPSTFFCPDPFTAPPDLVVPSEGSGFSILARRLRVE